MATKDDLSSVENQTYVCSVPPLPWYKRWFERKNRQHCVYHDIGYIERTGPRGDRSLMRYVVDEAQARRKVDSAFLQAMLDNSNNFFEKLSAYVSYGAVRLFGWSYWWDIYQQFRSLIMTDKSNIIYRTVSSVGNMLWGNKPVSRAEKTNTILTAIGAYLLYKYSGGEFDLAALKQAVACFLIDCGVDGLPIVPNA